MNATLLRSLPREASGIGKWLLVAFASGVFAFLGLAALKSSTQGEPDVLLSLTFLLPWIVGPAAVATLRVVRARSTGEAWLFIGAEAAAIVSTASLGILVLFIKNGHTNSESVIALILLPVVEFAAILVYAMVVIAIADLFIVRIESKKFRERCRFLSC